MDSSLPVIDLPPIDRKELLSTDTQSSSIQGSPIEFDTLDGLIKSLDGLYGINLEDTGTGDWWRDKMEPVYAGDLLKLPLNLSECAFEGRPPITFKFEDAVRLVIDVIHNNAQKSENFKEVPIFGTNMLGELLAALTNIETKRPDLVPNPPQYSLPKCSATISSNNSWLGVILRMLHDKGYISEYGQYPSRVEYWVNAKRSSPSEM